jgi:hemoglobin
MTHHVYRWLGPGLLSALTLSACSSARVLAPETLYERLGSLPGIEAVVEDFVANVEADPRINAFFARTARPKLKRWLAEFICANTGGPCQYTGRPMKAGHQDMGIREADFSALVEDLVRALDKHQTPERERGALLALLGGLKGEIVTRP